MPSTSRTRLNGPSLVLGPQDQVLTIRNYQEAQEQWEAPCACTANLAVLAELEYDNLLGLYNSTISESGADYLLYDFYPTSQLNKAADTARRALKNKYQKIIRETVLAPSRS